MIGGANVAAALVTLLVPAPYRFRKKTETLGGSNGASESAGGRGVGGAGEGEGHDGERVGIEGGAPSLPGAGSIQTAGYGAAAAGAGSDDLTHTHSSKQGVGASSSNSDGMGWPPATFFLFFIFYTALEIGVSNWIASFSVLNSLQTEVSSKH